MKKIYGLKLLCISTLCFLSCNKEDKEYIPQEVKFSLNYSFAESGSMSRATGDEVYTVFYDKYIKTRVLTPKTYELTFTNTETGVSSIIKGRWDSKNGIRLTEGQYDVVGKSTPMIDRFDFTELSDSVYIAFNESVYINKKDTQLTLNAQYDSFLLLFDKENTANIKYSCSGYTTDSSKFLMSDENNFWLFMQQTYRLEDKKHDYYLSISRNNGLKSTIRLLNTPFEKGKYYYFNNMTNSFDIPPMESGN